MLYHLPPRMPGEEIDALPRMPWARQAETLHALHTGEGLSLLELSRRTGWSVPVIRQKLDLMHLEPALRSELTAAGAPEGIGLALLRLPDEVSRLRVARSILRERLCIRDSALLVDAALRRMPLRTAHRGRVINLVRDPRPYINALRDIAGQMQDAGVRAAWQERRVPGYALYTLRVPLRNRRCDRYYKSM